MKIYSNKVLAGLFGLALAANCLAVQVPILSKKDGRIQHVMYDDDDVTQVIAAKGSSLLILLDPKERIDESSTGFRTDCQTDAEKGPPAEWCIVVKKGANKIWVKPNSTADWTDLQLTTDKRVYSFEFTAKPLPKAVGQVPTFRIVFDYPAPPPPPVDPNAGMPTAEQLAALADMQTNSALEQPKGKLRRNTNYTMQVVGNSQNIAPAETFDDGQFTYLRFPNNRDVPAVFTIDGEGLEKQVTKFWEKGTDYLVVERVYKRLILRKDKMAVGIWNESYDPEGVAAKDGTTVETVKRVVK